MYYEWNHGSTGLCNNIYNINTQYTLCIYGFTHYYAYPFTCQLTSSDLTDVKRQCVVAKNIMNDGLV